jgi:hypothetical protein
MQTPPADHEYASTIETALQAALKEQREPNYQQIFMQLSQKHKLLDEHWLALSLQVESWFSTK